MLEHIHWTKEQKLAVKQYLEWERRYWVNIFDNKPYRIRLVESDNWTMNIARIEIDRIDKTLEKLNNKENIYE